MEILQNVGYVFALKYEVIIRPVSPGGTLVAYPGLFRFARLFIYYLFIILFRDAFRVTTGYDMSHSVCNVLIKIRIL